MNFTDSSNYCLTRTNILKMLQSLVHKSCTLSTHTKVTDTEPCLEHQSYKSNDQWSVIIASNYIMSAYLRVLLQFLSNVQIFIICSLFIWHLLFWTRILCACKNLMKFAENQHSCKKWENYLRMIFNDRWKKNCLYILKGSPNCVRFLISKIFPYFY